jgi:flagellar basal body-associated protein FliL
MAKIGNILSIVYKVLSGLAMLCTTIISLSLGYIVFAPDSYPKPFYLQYVYPNGSNPAAIAGAPDQTSATQEPAITPTTEPVKAGQGLMFNTGSKIINLAEPGGRRYIRITVVLEFSPTDPTYDKMTAEEKATYVTNFNDEIKNKQPVIDDAIITIISTKTFDMLYTADGKESLRKEVLDQLRQRMPEYQILSVYFSEFVVE